MGKIRFQVHPASRVTARLLKRAYLAGMDQVPWRTWAQRVDGGFVLRRAETESGHAHIPWPIPGFGELTLATCSLVERARPYQLPLELARGKINQLRDQIAAWQAVGLVMPDPLIRRVDAALHCLGRAATGGHDPTRSAQDAETALVTAVEAADLLAACYTDQGLAARHRQSGKFDVLSSVTAPMTPASLGKVLHVTGSVNSKGNPFPIEEITAALNELIVAGRVAKVRRHGAADLSVVVHLGQSWTKPSQMPAFSV